MNYNRDHRHSKILAAHIKEHGNDRLRGVVQDLSREELFNASVPFAIDVASRYKNHPVDMDDMIQQALLGVWVAAEKFDPDTGNGFLTYAKWWCMAYLQEYVAEMSGAARIPPHAWVEYRRSRRNGEDSERERVVSSHLNAVSLYAPLSDGGPRRETLLVDALEDEDADPTESAYVADLRASIGRALSHLPERHAYVLAANFGIGCDERPLEDIKHDLGVSRERVRQIRNEALDFIRANRAGDFDELWEQAESMFDRGIGDVPFSKEWKGNRMADLNGPQRPWSPPTKSS